jgi:membrane-bound lytic murein transglycosylase A
MPARLRLWRPIALALGLAALAGAASATTLGFDPLIIPDAQIEPVAWADLPGWSEDDHAAALATMQKSCRPIVRSAGESRAAGAPEDRSVSAALRRVCARALKPIDPGRARGFLEDNFRPARISRLGESDGLLTGYYEPIVDGALAPSEEYTAPLYRRPWNLIAAGRSRTGVRSFPNKGRVGRLVGRRKIVPFYDRGEIEDGVLAGRNLEIAWLKNPGDVLFAQIQGSVRVRLPDGGVLRLNYDGHNGHPYTPVGRILIERGLVPRDEMSMDRIRQWMRDNPDGAAELRRKNQSYVFFRTTNLAPDEEAVGGQGIPLTAWRSIAVDRALHAYGTPFFIDAALPIESGEARTPFRRLMVAQDTGSAIVGPARADLYFGAGDEAGRIAGRIRQPGRFAILLPREIDPVAIGARAPLPRVRPDGEPRQIASGPPRKASAHGHREPKKKHRRRR